LLGDLRASAEGVVRGGEPVAAFIAILDGERQKIEWACAGHPGGYLVSSVTEKLTPVVLGGGGAGLGASNAIAMRGTSSMSGRTLIVASSGLRGRDEAAWFKELASIDTYGARIAVQLVGNAVDHDDPHEDLLAVVVRDRGGA
jgi:hypothetical protein